jgi:hypothetical protein
MIYERETVRIATQVYSWAGVELDDTQVQRVRMQVHTRDGVLVTGYTPLPYDMQSGEFVVYWTATAPGDYRITVEVDEQDTKSIEQRDLHVSEPFSQPAPRPMQRVGLP